MENPNQLAGILNSSAAALFRQQHCNVVCRDALKMAIKGTDVPDPREGDAAAI
jgi:hypothetical protein